jgi:RanBP1 domain
VAARVIPDFGALADHLLRIREAKGSLGRRRTPGTSPAPTGNPLSHTQSTPNFFSGINPTPTTPAFGANGINGAQQQSFAAPSSNTFNFTAPTGSNPFAAPGPSNPFSTQNSSISFGQNASTGEQQGSIFRQPLGSQSSSNTFGVPSRFNFGQSSGVNSSFPQTQNHSLFSKSTPASSSFTFGSNPSFPTQTPTFGGSTQKPAADGDTSMDASGESPLKRSAKSAAPDQSTETKPAAPAFGGSIPFSFNPTSSGASQGSKAQSSLPIGSVFQPKPSPAEQIPPGPAPKAAEKQPPHQQSTKPSAPVFNFFPKPKELETENSQSSDAQPSIQPSNLFVGSETAEKETTQEKKTATRFAFGAPPSKTEDQGRALEQKAPGAAPSNPFQRLQPSGTGNHTVQPQEQDSVSTLFQPTQSNSSTLFDPSQNSKSTVSEKPQTSDLFTSVQPSKSAGAEHPQTPPFNPFQSLQPTDAEKSAQEAPKSSASASNLFLPPKPITEDTSNMPKSPIKFTSNNVPHAPKPTDETYQQERAGISHRQTLFTPSSDSIFKDSQSTKVSESPFESNTTQPDSAVGNATEQSKKSDIGITRSTSHTSHLFTESLAQSSTPTPKPIMDSSISQSDIPPFERSPTTARSVTEKKMGGLSTSTILPDTAIEPFMVKVKSHGASNVPQELDNDGFADFDKSYRLRSLNEKFKKQIAELDPDEHDFEPIVRFYATQRAAIGYPMGGLYHRVKAGEKRKTEEAGRVEEAPNAAKRAKLEKSTTPFDEPAIAPVIGFSAITSVSTMPQPVMAGAPENERGRSVVSSNLTTYPSTTQQPATATSNTSNIFKSILSSSAQPSFGTQKRLSPTLSPSEPVSATSFPKPTVQQVQPSPSSIFTPVNSKTSMSQSGAQSNSNTEVTPATNGARNTSQLFQSEPGTASISQPPEFTAADSTDFMATFAAQAQKNAARMEAENKAKRKAEEFDSDEDDEAEYDRRTAEEDRAKRARIQAIANAGSGFTPVLSSASSANGASPAAELDGESTGDASREGSGHCGEDEESESEESQKEDTGDGQDKEEDDQEEESDDDDIQTAMAKSHAKAKNPFESSSDPRSLFNRITKPDGPTGDKGSKTDIASPATLPANSSVFSAPPGTGLFGSRPSTPSHESPKPSGDSIFSGVASSTLNGDNTWKPGSAIKFGAPSSAPAVNITPATPLAKTNGDTTQSAFSAFSAAASTGSKPTHGNGDDTPKSSTSLFGIPSFAVESAAGPSAETPKPYSALFGDASKKTAVNQSSAAQVGWSFGGPNKLGASPLLVPSNVGSAVTSRATSPGHTDNESAAESGTDDQATDLQSDFMTARPGEESEEVLFELRTKALEFMSERELSAIGSKEEAGWKTRGLGPLRVLRDSETGRARIVMRSDPGAGVVINSPLIQDNKYDASASGKESASLKTGIYMNGKLKNWVFKIKNMEIARELVDCLKENEPNAKQRDKA